MALTLLAACAAGAPLPGASPPAGGGTGGAATGAATAAGAIRTFATAVPSATPTPLAQRTPLALPATHPMAWTWVLGPVPGVFERVSRLAVSPDGNLYLLDTTLHRIAAFDRTGAFRHHWGTRGIGPGEFTFVLDGLRSSAIAVAPGDLVYVADATNRIQKFDGAGRYLGLVAGPGSGDGEVKRVAGMAVGRTGELYITDVDNRRIQRFDAAGRYQSKWSLPLAPEGVIAFGGTLAVDNQGHVIVTDSLNRVIKMAPDGSVLSVWGVRGTGDGEFRSGMAVAVGPSNTVFVADSGNQRVQVFDTDGNYVAQWGLIGGQAGQFRIPSGIAVDSAGDIYVADVLNQRVQKFRPRQQWPAVGKGTPTPRPPTPTVTPTNSPAPIGPPPFMTPVLR